MNFKHENISENKRLSDAWEKFDEELKYQNFDGFSRYALFTLFQQAYILMNKKEEKKKDV